MNDNPPTIPENFDCDDMLALALHILKNTLRSGVQELPDCLKSHKDFMEFYNHTLAGRNAMEAFGQGRLNVHYDAPEFLFATLGRIQERFTRLLRQLSDVALGKSPGQMEDMGDFTQAFNQMAENLKHWRDQVESKNEELVKLNNKLHKKIARQDNIEAAIRASENVYRQMALRDPLTGIYNRNYFFEAATQEIERIKRLSGSICLLMMDVDHFKRVNDSHGHLAGDAALKMLTAAVSEHLRKTDLLARYGGEEFALLLGNTNMQSGILIADRIRAAVAKQPVPGLPRGISITISVGISCINGEKIVNGSSANNVLNNVLMQADAALYSAKESGRNMVWWQGRHSPQNACEKIGDSE